MNVVRPDLETLRFALSAQIVAALPEAEQVYFVSLHENDADAHFLVDPLPSAVGEESLSLLRQGHAVALPGWLLFSWQPHSGLSLAVVVRAGRLPSLSPESAALLATQLARQLTLCCQCALDPCTGLHNLRALDSVLSSAAGASHSLLLACIAVGGIDDGPWNRKGLWGRTVEMLAARSSRPLFSLGGGQFVLLRDGDEPREGRSWARRCLRGLRRLGIVRAHIGLLLLEGSDIHVGKATDLLARCRQACHVAEAQGDMGQHLDDFGRSDNWPPPPEALILALRRQRRKGFALALLASDGDWPLPFTAGDLAQWSEEASAGEQARSKPCCYPLDTRQAFVLLPELDGIQGKRWVHMLQERCGGPLPGGGFSCGLASYPSAAGQGRQQLPDQCRKALKHAAFYGSGTVTLFDAVSSNICGDWYFDQGDLWAAVKEYRLGLRMTPDSLNLLNSLGVAWAELFQHRRAVSCFRQVLARDLQNFMAWINLGQSLVELGDEEGALACFESALDSGGSEAAGMDAATRNDLLLQLGRIYGRRQRHREALALLESCRRENPAQESQLLPLLAQAHAGQGQGEQARRCAQRAVQLRPDDGAALSLLGILYLQDGQGEDIALSLCRQAVLQSPADPLCWQRLCEVLLHMGRADEETLSALQRCKQLVRRQRDTVPLWQRFRALRRSCDGNQARRQGAVAEHPYS